MALKPTYVVMGATDPEGVAAFLEAFGFAVAQRQRLEARAAGRLYGLEQSVEEARLEMPGATGGGLRVVQTPYPAAHGGPFALGPHAIDLYTTDIERSRALADAAGARCGPIVAYAVGPLAIRELKAVGPDHTVVVFIQVDRRRPSVLDADPRRVHSEVHSAVWTVAKADAVLPFWRDEAGLRLLLDATLREPAVAALMELPRPDAPLRLIVLADDAAGPPRFELVEFPEDPDTAVPTWPIRSGLHALGAEVRDLDGAARALPGVTWREPADLPDGLRAVTGEAPGGVRLELRERRV